LLEGDRLHPEHVPPLVDPEPLLHGQHPGLVGKRRVGELPQPDEETLANVGVVGGLQPLEQGLEQRRVTGAPRSLEGHAHQVLVHRLRMQPSIGAEVGSAERRRAVEHRPVVGLDRQVPDEPRPELGLLARLTPAGGPPHPGQHRPVELAHVGLGCRALLGSEELLANQAEDGSRLLGHRGLGVVGHRPQGGQGVRGGERSTPERRGEVAGQREPLGGPERAVPLLEQRAKLIGGQHPPVVALGVGVEGEPGRAALAPQPQVGLGVAEQHAIRTGPGPRGVDADRDLPALTVGER
jgi:hypothetical protein